MGWADLRGAQSGGNGLFYQDSGFHQMASTVLASPAKARIAKESEEQRPAWPTHRRAPASVLRNPKDQKTQEAPSRLDCLAKAKENHAAQLAEEDLKPAWVLPGPTRESNSELFHLEAELKRLEARGADRLNSSDLPLHRLGTPTKPYDGQTPTKASQPPKEPETIKARLTAFYSKYEPQKVKEVDLILQELSRSGRSEQELSNALEHKYGEGLQPSAQQQSQSVEELRYIAALATGDVGRIRQAEQAFIESEKRKGLGRTSFHRNQSAGSLDNPSKNLHQNGDTCSSLEEVPSTPSLLQGSRATASANHQRIERAPHFRFERDLIACARARNGAGVDSTPEDAVGGPYRWDPASNMAHYPEIVRGDHVTLAEFVAAGGCEADFEVFCKEAAELGCYSWLWLRVVWVLLSCVAAALSCV